MKKTLSCLLAFIMLVCCLTGTASAAEEYKKAYSVAVDPNSSSLIELVDLDPEILTDANYTDTNNYFIVENAAPVVGSKVPANKAIIAVRAANSYRFDQTSCIKVFPKTKHVDVLNGVEYGQRAETVDYEPVSPYGQPLHMEILKNGEGVPIDEFGEPIKNIKLDTSGKWVGNTVDFIYVVEFFCVTEDIVVGVYNVNDATISDVKDFLFNMFYFFVEMIKWFFGLTTAKPEWPV